MKSLRAFNSIHHKLLLTSLVPLGLLCMALGWYMISSQSSKLQVNLNDKGKIAVNQTASFAEFAVSSGDTEMLEVLGQTVLKDPAVTGILFTSYQDGELTVSYTHLTLPTPPSE